MYNEGKLQIHITKYTALLSVCHTLYLNCISGRMPGFNRKSGNGRVSFNLQEIRRFAANFRRLMLIFPYIHPAALHGIIVKNNFNWEHIMQVLFAGYRVRSMQFWDRVYQHRDLEQILQRNGIQLVCSNGISEIMLAAQGEIEQPTNTFIQQQHMIAQSLGLETMDPGNADTPHNSRQEQNGINITIEQNPSTSMQNQLNAARRYKRDVIRIIFEQNSQDGSFEVQFQSNSAQAKQVTLVDERSTSGEVQNIQIPKRIRATKQGDKKSRNTKQKRPASSECANEQTGAQNDNTGTEIEQEQTVSKKGKATSKTRVKSSKKTNNTDNNN